MPPSDLGFLGSTPLRRLLVSLALTWMMTGVLVWGIITLVNLPDDASMKTLLLYFSICFYAFLGIAFAKGWFQLMQNHIAVMKELKRTQLMMLELNAER